MQPVPTAATAATLGTTHLGGPASPWQPLVSLVAVCYFHIMVGGKLDIPNIAGFKFVVLLKRGGKKPTEKTATPVSRQVLVKSNILVSKQTDNGESWGARTEERRLSQQPCL